MRKFLSLLMACMLSSVMSMAQNADYNISCYDHTVDWYEGLWIDYGSDQSPLPVYDGWNIIMKGKGGEKVIVCILDMDKLGHLVDGRTYTEADIVTDWTGITPYGTFMEDLSQDNNISYTQTHDDEGKLHVVFDMVGNSGKTYHVTYDESCQVVGQVQELQFTDDEVTLMNNTSAPAIRNFQIIAEVPGTVSIMIGVNSDKVPGHYTINDVIADFSDITWGDTQNGEYSVLKFCDVDMVVTEDPEKAGAYYYDINVITKLGYGYHTKLHSTPWEAPTDIEITKEETIHANNLRMMDYRDSWGELLFVASCPDYSLNLYTYANEPQGTFTKDDIDFEYNYIWYYENGVEKQTTAFNGEYTYVENADGSRSLTGWLECLNGVRYILDLKYSHAEPTRSVVVEYAEGLIDDQRGPDGGGIVINADSGDALYFIAIYTDEIEGTYNEQNMDWQSTFVVEFDNPRAEEYMLTLLDANVTVDYIGDDNYHVVARLTMQAEMNKNDIVEYSLDFIAYEPTGAGIKDITTTSARKAQVRKVLRNGHVVLMSKDNYYGANGVKLSK